VSDKGKEEVTEIEPLDDSALALLKFEKFDTLVDNVGDSQSVVVRLKIFEVYTLSLLFCFTPSCVLTRLTCGRLRGSTTLDFLQRQLCVLFLQLNHQLSSFSTSRFIASVLKMAPIQRTSRLSFKDYRFVRSSSELEFGLVADSKSAQVVSIGREADLKDSLKELWPKVQQLFSKAVAVYQENPELRQKVADQVVQGAEFGAHFSPLSMCTFALFSLTAIPFRIRRYAGPLAR